MPKQYSTSLKSAFKDEQETVDFYLDLADQTQDQSIKKVFQRAAADEQNHAVWFLYLLIHSSTQQTRQANYGAAGALNAGSLTLPQMLTYAIQDEYLAQARYNEIISNFGNIRTFIQIKEAELRHINALLSLLNDTRYRYLKTSLTYMSLRHYPLRLHLLPGYKEKLIISLCITNF